MTRSVAIVGAGIVGICTAIELLKTGHKVTLFDREAPGSQASRWNAGVLATSSIIPLNNPALIGRLPFVLAGRVPGFRLNRAELFTTLPWAARFLANSHTRKFNRVVRALHDLIGLSHRLHEATASDLGQPDLLTKKGWIFVYRTRAGFMASAFQERILNQYGIANQVLEPEVLAELEPGLTGNVYKARHMVGSASAEPADLLGAYINYVHRLGGDIRRVEVKGILRTGDDIALSFHDGAPEKFGNVVVAAGAWSNKVLRSVNVKLPMVVERGYLNTYTLQGATRLHRPVFDVEAGYVVSPRRCGIQISTGTELTTIDAKPNDAQLFSAVEQLKTLLPLGDSLMTSPAVSNRPSLSDSLPAIGPVKKIPGLWLATGHQHLGFSTSAGTGHLLSAQINATTAEIDPRPYLPDRFRI